MQGSDRVEIDVQLKIVDLYWLYIIRAVSDGWLVRSYIGLGISIVVAVAPQHLVLLAILLLPPYVFILLAICLYFILIKPYRRAQAVVISTHGASASNHYIFSDQGIDIKGAHSQLHYDWAAVMRARQSARVFVLYLSKFSMIVLPKRCFITPEQSLSFIRLASQNVTKRNQSPPEKSSVK